MFASLTAHTTAILPVMLAVGAAIPGLPVKTFALLLCYSLGIMGVITPYATGPGPVYYGSGYISRKDFWTLGLIFGMIFLIALIGIGVPYLLANELPRSKLRGIKAPIRNRPFAASCGELTRMRLNNGNPKHAVSDSRKRKEQMF